MPARYLPIYLNDHLAGATLGVELARRACRENAGSELGEFLEGLHGELVEDRESLLGVMRTLGIAPSRAKVVGAWVAEKAGRLKLNGEVTSYSPLSRLLELEGLAGGIEGKRSLWLALQQIRESDARLRDVDLERLVARAAEQRERLEPFRQAAAATALG
jgi:predicted DNA-binding ribbon-helix-helix protein